MIWPWVLILLTLSILSQWIYLDLVCTVPKALRRCRRSFAPFLHWLAANWISDLIKILFEYIAADSPFVIYIKRPLLFIHENEYIFLFVYFQYYLFYYFLLCLRKRNIISEKYYLQCNRKYILSPFIRFWSSVILVIKEIVYSSFFFLNKQYIYWDIISIFYISQMCHYIAENMRGAKSRRKHESRMSLNVH